MRVRVDRLHPGRKYKLVTFMGNLGLGIITVDEVIVLMANNPNKLYEVNYTLDNEITLIKVSSYSEFEEIR